MIKVLQFVEGLSQGGIESFITNVVHNANKDKIACDFLVLKTAKAAKLEYVYENQILNEGSRIYYLIDYDTSKYNTVKKGRIYIDALKKWLNKYGNQYDVVHIHASHLVNFYPIISEIEKYGIKRIFLHSHSSDNQSFKINLFHRFFRICLDFNQNVNRLACGVQAGRWMYGGKKFEIITNGIEIEKFVYSIENRKCIRKQLDIPLEAKVIGHVGAFREEKNHFYLINIFMKYHESHPDSYLLLIGEGKLKKDVMAKVEILGIKDSVLFLGNRTDVNEILSALDCLLLPSFFEGVSVSAIEAQANGVPMIISDKVSPETILCNKVSVCPIEETEYVYEQWCKTMEESVNQGREGIVYKPHFWQYDIKATVQKLEMLYEKSIT